MTEHEKLMERVARAIYVAPYVAPFGDEGSFEHRSDAIKELFRMTARAALAEVYAALREPTDGVVKACLIAAGISPAEADDHPLSMAVRRQYRTGIAASPLNPEN